ncbi:hypothetical protein HGM15179_015169 [Zosterops borbonicus]|uniref:Uncharacterized protein n=1 Tax=Zosterops borbonicus TaxID=364589 RepID=A0A8K1LFL9_9PASS|nr:hypothetical protein HGM15179_015169 [Zosterops borbonicus]
MARAQDQPPALSDTQLRPLFLLALADFLGAAALLGTGTIPLLPAPLSVPAYAACPYGRMLTTTSYAVSFLMVVVYAYESHRTVLGGRARPPAALQAGVGQNAGLEEKIIFLLYLLLVLGCCSLLYRRVRLRCRGKAALPLLSLGDNGGSGAGSGRSVSRASFNFQLVFLLCWAPAFLLTILSFSSISPASLFVLYVSTGPEPLSLCPQALSVSLQGPEPLSLCPQALSVSLQGFLHSLVYGWMRENFRREVLARSPALHSPEGLKAFYDDSLGADP